MRSDDEVREQASYYDVLAKKAHEWFWEVQGPPLVERAYKLYTEYQAKADALQWVLGNKPQLEHTVFPPDYTGKRSINQ